MKKEKSLLFLCGILVFLLVLCSLQKVNKYFIIDEDKMVSHIDWTKEELKQELAVRTLRSTDHASYHLIRIKGKEKPHFHDTHDLVVFALSGEGVVDFKKKRMKFSPGDVIEIPKGTLHAGVCLSSNACEVYAVFSPAYDGKDYREVK